MGLLSKMTSGATINQKVGDEVHLLHGLMLMAGADGVIEQGEWNSLQQYWATLPEFRGKDFTQVHGQAQKVLNQFSNVQESVNALADIEDELVRQKMFVLAVDLAMSSGDVDSNEDALLETMQRVLNISDDLARQIIQVLAIKYARPS